MKLAIDISEEDIKKLMQMTLTIDEMDNTVKGRVIMAIVHAVHEQENEDGNDT